MYAYGADTPSICNLTLSARLLTNRRNTTMAHEIHQMAYVGAQPWHGLGNRLSPNQPLEVWQREAGMDWTIESSPVYFRSETKESFSSADIFPDQNVLFRSDTKQPLSVVSQRYQVVQPNDVLEFYRDLTSVSGFELETAGVLKGGRKFWALARTGQSVAFKGGDKVDGYLLLATSCDGTLATTATPTTVRVVCNNTLALSLNGATSAIKVPHNTRFDPDLVKKHLGIAVSQWDEFMYEMRTLAERKVSSKEAERFFNQVLSVTSTDGTASSKQTNRHAISKAHSLYDGRGKGAELASAKGTAWGLLNAVTEFIDHEKRARSADYRMDSAWFGQGATLKQRALHAALTLVD
jgi:phage/plasmid-like protein (TIGR03299 family)